MIPDYARLSCLEDSLASEERRRPRSTEYSKQNHSRSDRPHWFFFLNIASLPLGAAINSFLAGLIFIDVAIVNPYLVCKTPAPGRWISMRGL